MEAGSFTIERCVLLVVSGVTDREHGSFTDNKSLAYRASETLRVGAAGPEGSSSPYSSQCLLGKRFICFTSISAFSSMIRAVQLFAGTN